MRKLFLILMTLVACTWSLQAQTRTYHGTVLDAANNEPLIGATVMPIGGGQGVAADIDGKFTLTVPANVTKAKVTYVGYKEQTVDLRDGMTIHLASTSTSLDEMVVVAYGTASKESLTGSVAVVGAKEIEDRPVSAVTAALEGNAPGVQVNNSAAQPGSEPTIRIRGFNSMYGSMAPLVVVDGVPFSGSINDLNPADIESMSVLKDAASSALYGNRGANGVILITTKRAKTAGNVEVNLTIREGMYNRGLPFYDRQTPNQWMQTLYTSYVNGGSFGPYYDDQFTMPSMETIAQQREYYATGTGNRTLMNAISPGSRSNIYGVENTELYDPETGLFIPTHYLPGYTDLDWWNAIARNGLRQEYNVNASAATENFNIFASVGYLNEKGYVLGTDFDRFTGRLNANFQPTSYLRIGVNLSASQQESETGQEFSQGSTNNPFATQFYNPVKPYYKHNADGTIMYNEDGDPEWALDEYQSNVAWELRLNDNNYSTTTLDGNAYLTAVIPYGFELTFRGSMYRNKTNYQRYTNNVVGSNTEGMLFKEYDQYKTHTFMQTLTWEHQYGDNHIDVLLDHENFNYQVEYDYTQKVNQQMDGYINFNIFSDVDYLLSGFTQRRTESYLARARYNYNQQYFLEASIRRDGTSKLAKDHRWGTFWSLGASWIISKEKFMQNVDWLNYLKLRASYGSVGNDMSLPNYASHSYYDYSIYNGGEMATLLPAYIGNTALKWEATKTFDVALEGSLFNDRFNFTVGYFNKLNSDLIFPEVLPTSTGTFSNSGSNMSIYRNIGTVQNYGWELQFGVDIIRTRDLTWDFNVDATFLTNRVKKLPGGHDLPGQNLFYNKAIYQIRTLTWAGVDQMTGQSMYLIDPNSPDLIKDYDAAGKPIYYSPDESSSYEQRVAAAKSSTSHVFIEKDGKVYTSDSSLATRQLQGNVLPTVYGSFSTSLSWKGINLGLLFTYQLGGKTLDGNYQQIMTLGQNGASALSTDLLRAWTAAPEGMTFDSPDRIDPNGVPVLNYLRSTYNDYSSSRFVTSTSYLTLKNLSLSYDIPKKWSNAMKLKNINLGVFIDNVFIVAKRKGLNPTYNFAGGSQAQTYVPARVFAFQLSAKF